LISTANFVAVHQFNFFERLPVLDAAMPGATVLINSPYKAEDLFDHLPVGVIRKILDRQLKVYVLDAMEVAKTTEMGGRINTIMQVGFFAISGVLPRPEAIEQIKAAIKKTYGKFGEPVIRKNFAAVDSALDHLHQVDTSAWSERLGGGAGVSSAADLGQQKRDCCSANGHDTKCQANCCGQVCTATTMEMIAGRGDLLPVSALPVDGTFPTGTAKLEKRDIAFEIPVWDPNVCIQCGKCVMVCPHAVIRSKVADKDCFADGPAGLKKQNASWRELKDQLFTIQVSAEDCTGCALCVEICPAKNKSQTGLKAINMTERSGIDLEAERKNWNYFLSLPDQPHDTIAFNTVKNVQLLEPLFEFSGACAGCGETPYVKLLSQLFGDRAMIANATGCSSIYGGNLPATPWTKNKEGRGPAWSNSLFEDNAEFGLGMRLAVKVQSEHACRLLNELKEQIGSEICTQLLADFEAAEHQQAEQRERIAQLKERLAQIDDVRAKDLLNLAD